jgi:hypothetical protein
MRNCGRVVGRVLRAAPTCACSQRGAATQRGRFEARCVVSLDDAKVIVDHISEYLKVAEVFSSFPPRSFPPRQRLVCNADFHAHSFGRWHEHATDIALGAAAAR